MVLLRGTLHMAALVCLPLNYKIEFDFVFGIFLKLVL